MKIVALLPMKAHSERVTGKNFREFCGKPLFKWVLDTLLQVDKIDQIVINTDGRNILQNHGVTDSARVMIRDRAAGICGDHVSMNKVLQDDIDHVPADMYIMTHTTNPLLSAETIRGCISAYTTALAQGQADSLFTVNKVQARFYRADGSAVNHDPDRLVPTQELEPWFEENSNLYVFSKDSFSKTSARIGGRPVLYESPHVESVDIDTPEDWEIALAVASYVAGKNEAHT